MFINPYENIGAADGTWRKANFHTHAGVLREGACGRLPMEDVIDAYERAGYDTLAISNHDGYVPYTGGGREIALIDAVEYSKDEHMLLIGASRFEDVPHQRAIDDTRAAGGFVILCHPNWQHREYWPFERMEALRGYAGIEIVNGVIPRLSGSAIATDLWDRLLSKGRTVWGFGNDDFHEWMDIARVHNRIFAASGSLADIRAAVEAGAFYVSTGLTLEEYDFDGETLRVRAGSPTPTYVDCYRYEFFGGGGKLPASADGREARCAVAADEPYVRVEVTGETGAKLYTQPLRNAGFFAGGEA